MAGTKTVGFGTAPHDEGVVASPADAELAQNPAQSMAEDIRAIKDRYVLPGGLLPVQINLAQNQAVKVDVSQWQTNAILVTANSGVLFFWFGDFTTVNGVAQTFSHGVVSAGIAPVSQTIPLPPGAYIFTIQANGGAATGYATPMAL